MAAPTSSFSLLSSSPKKSAEDQGKPVGAEKKVNSSLKTSDEDLGKPVGAKKKEKKSHSSSKTFVVNPRKPVAGKKNGKKGNKACSAVSKTSDEDSDELVTKEKEVKGNKSCKTVASCSSKTSDADSGKPVVGKGKGIKACGLCGKTARLTKTECCNNWICDDEHKYVPFSYARNSCHRNHSRYTLCAHHHNERHAGNWQEGCKKCKDLGLDWYVEYGTNEYNFEKLKNPPKINACCKKDATVPGPQVVWLNPEFANSNDPNISNLLNFNSFNLNSFNPSSSRQKRH